MEINDEREITILTPIRLIRQFNESIQTLEKMGATGSIKESVRMRDRLLHELQQLTTQLTEPTLFA